MDRKTKQLLTLGAIGAAVWVTRDEIFGINNILASLGPSVGYAAPPLAPGPAGSTTAAAADVAAASKPAFAGFANVVRKQAPCRADQVRIPLRGGGYRCAPKSKVAPSMGGTRSGTRYGT